MQRELTIPSEKAPMRALKKAVSRSPTTSSPEKTNVDPYQNAKPYIPNIININDPKARPNKALLRIPTVLAALRFFRYLYHRRRENKLKGKKLCKCFFVFFAVLKL